MDNQLPKQNLPVQPVTPPSDNSSVVVATPNKTKKMLLITVAIFFLMLTGVAAYLMLGQKPTPQPAAKTVVIPPTPTPNPTANWQTYSNAALGFSFLYPKELAYPYDQLGDLISKKSTQGLLLLQNYDGSKPPPTENTLQIVIEISRSKTSQLDQYVKSLIDLSKLHGLASGSASTKTAVAGQPAEKFVTIQKGDQITNVAFKYLDLLYNVSISSAEKEKGALLDQVLATFKFIPVTTTAPSASAAATITP